jgi:hypothetical protein
VKFFLSASITLFFASLSAPASNKSFTIAVSPPAEALMSAVKLTYTKIVGDTCHRAEREHKKRTREEGKKGEEDEVDESMSVRV